MQDPNQPPSQPKPGMSGATAETASAPAPQQGAPKTPADPAAVQQELQRGLQGLSEALYSNEKTSDAIIKMLSDSEKVGSAAKAAMFAATQIIQKAELAERVAVPLAVVAADEVMQMGDAIGLEYSEEEAKQVTMSTAEMMLSAYGVDPEKARAIGETASPEMKKGMEDIYSGSLKPEQGASA